MSLRRMVEEHAAAAKARRVVRVEVRIGDARGCRARPPRDRLGAGARGGGDRRGRAADRRRSRRGGSADSAAPPCAKTAPCAATPATSARCSMVGTTSSWIGSRSRRTDSPPGGAVRPRNGRSPGGMGIRRLRQTRRPAPRQRAARRVSLGPGFATRDPARGAWRAPLPATLGPSEVAMRHGLPGTIGESLLRSGVSRRALLEFCGKLMIAAPAGLAIASHFAREAVAKEIFKARRPSVIWLHFQDCTGCTETLLRTSRARPRRPAAQPDLARLPRDRDGRVRQAGRGGARATR